MYNCCKGDYIYSLKSIFFNIVCCKGLSDKPNQKVLLPKLPADTLISKEYIKPSCIQNHDLESQLKTPRPPRLTRPKSQKEMVHGEEFDVSNRAIADDVNLKQNLVIDHPVNQENRLDRESLKVRIAERPFLWM